MPPKSRRPSTTAKRRPTTTAKRKTPAKAPAPSDIQPQKAPETTVAQVAGRRTSARHAPSEIPEAAPSSPSEIPATTSTAVAGKRKAAAAPRLIRTPIHIKFPPTSIMLALKHEVKTQGRRLCSCHIGPSSSSSRQHISTSATDSESDDSDYELESVPAFSNESIVDSASSSAQIDHALSTGILPVEFNDPMEVEQLLTF